VAGAVRALAGFQIVNTMGRLMQEALIGGQLVYPYVDDTWRDDTNQRAYLLGLVEDIATQKGCDLALSIDLGLSLIHISEPTRPY